MEESLQGSLRNGHLHTLAHPPVARTARHGDGLKRRICQSLCDLGCPKATLRSAKTRRLRFPFFKTTCQRAATRAPIPADPTRSTLETANSVPVTRPEARYLRLRAMPVEGGEAHQCVATGRNKYQARPGVNTLVKKSWGSRQHSYNLLLCNDSFRARSCGSVPMLGHPAAASPQLVPACSGRT